MKANNVEVQKGELKINEPTMKNQTYAQRAAEDAKNDAGRKSGITPSLMTPSKGK